MGRRHCYHEGAADWKDQCLSYRCWTTRSSMCRASKGGVLYGEHRPHTALELASEWQLGSVESAVKTKSV